MRRNSKTSSRNALSGGGYKKFECQGENNAQDNAQALFTPSPFSVLSNLGFDSDPIYLGWYFYHWEFILER
jgi:hypothetical protein